MPEQPNLPADLMKIKPAVDGPLSYLGDRFVRRLVEERKVRSYRVGGTVLVSPSEIEALIASGERPARPAVA